jgi:[ribosomal protein S18]-alanine N-acetyltransferase
MNTELICQQRCYQFRDMQITDLDAIQKIEQVAQQNPWPTSHFISSLASSHHCYVLTYQQNIVAYGITSTAADEAELLTITVAPAYQRKGLGRLLLEQLCTLFDHTIHTLFLEVRVSNQGAIALYESLGFNEVGLRPRYYPTKNGRSEDALIMAKPL